MIDKLAPLAVALAIVLVVVVAVMTGRTTIHDANGNAVYIDKTILMRIP